MNKIAPKQTFQSTFRFSAQIAVDRNSLF